MHTIQTTLTVTEKGEILVPVIVGLPAGEHKAVLVIQEVAEQPTKGAARKPLELHAFALTDGRNESTYSRQEIYNDDGR